MPIYKKVNKDFFKKWTSETAYVLGFFAADGYITLNKRGANFWCIQITDKNLLYQIRDCVGSEHKISKRFLKNSKKNLYRLQIGSKNMCNDLRSLGYNENKTKSLSLPNVPEVYLPDFIRGYFDGDGNVWAGLINKNRKTPTRIINTVFTSCSDIFLKQLNECLKISGVANGILRKEKGNFFRLTYSVSGSLKIYDFMYNSKVKSSYRLFLKRKKRIFEKFIKMRS